MGKILFSAILLLVLTMILYIFLNKIIRWHASTNIKFSSSRNHWLYVNVSCSLIHSVISACLTTWCMINEPLFLWELIGTSTSYSTYIIASSGGYFLYDTIDILMNDGTRQMSVLLHHYIILVAFSFALLTSSYHGFALCALLMEFNSIFLHLRRILKWLGHPSHTLLSVSTKIFLVVTMIIFRHLLSIYLIYYMWSKRYAMPWLPFCIGLSSTLVFIPVNIGLSYKIYKNDFKNKEE